MKARIALAACLLLALLPKVSHSEVWNLANDFSGTQNPTGAWSYGWRNTGNDPFILYTDTTPSPGCPDAGIEFWSYNIDNGNPFVSHNPFPYPVNCGYDYPALAVYIQPGPAQECVIRWTAPYDMQVHLAASFLGIDIGSKTVRIYHNGVELFSRDLHGQEGTDYAATIDCRAGDVIDCAIDPIISDGWDITQLTDVLTSVGPPTGACCFASGGCLVGTQADCKTAGGLYMGDGTSCDPNPCGAVPIKGTTWGQIKSAYR